MLLIKEYRVDFGSVKKARKLLPCKLSITKYTVLFCSSKSARFTTPAIAIILTTANDDYVEDNRLY
jgi:hypothetical protein